MRIFTRVRDIISSNINSILDKAEDPEKMVRLMIQEMEDTLVEVRVSCAGVMAARKKVQRQLQECRDRAVRWEEKAELAISKGREDLAREALFEKRRYVEHADSLERELAQNDELIEQYQEDLRQLEEKLAAAREKQRILVQRHIHAVSKKRAQVEIRRAETTDAFRRFEDFENRIERMEADADLVNYGRKASLEESFKEREEDEEIEREMENLRSRLSKPEKRETSG